MARILTVSPDEARGLRRLLVWAVKRYHRGVVPGLIQILLADFHLLAATGWMVSHLDRPGSPLTRLQREMVATVVNGLIGGAP